MPPGLYVVATPIGNMGDITLRAIDILKRAAAVACEDTRVSVKLLQRHGIVTPLLPYHEHNAETMRPRLLAQIARGEAVALISDAGTPLVSDPGYKLVREALGEGLPVQAAPGASAALTALVLSGLPPDRFFFAGFLDVKQAARRRDLAGLVAVPGTLIFYETAPRLAASLADMATELGDRPAAVARELTKLFEEVRRGSLAELAAHYAETGPPKGEIVIVVGPPQVVETTAASLDEALRLALVDHSVSEAVAIVAARTGAARRRVYSRALELAQAEPGTE